MTAHLFAVSTDFRQTWIVTRYTVAEAEIWATHRSHNLTPPVARYYAMAADARDARAVVAAYGMAADAGTVAESFVVEMRGRWKAIPVISRKARLESQSGAYYYPVFDASPAEAGQ